MNKINTKDDPSILAYPKGATWCVTHYVEDGYDGYGTAYAGDGNGNCWTASLGHHSNCEPIEHVDEWDSIQLSDMRMELIGDTSGMAAAIREHKLADV